jgi:hypothetical protein
MPAEVSCTLTPTEDLIERWVTPKLPANAVVVGDVDLAHCARTVDTFIAGVPSGPGYCVQIARAADNPRYNAEAKPAAPLRKVMAQAGAAC